VDFAHTTVRNSPQQLLEIHRCSRQNRVHRISGSTLQSIALQPVFRLQMSDAGFHGGAVLHSSPQRLWRSASASLVDMDRCLAFVIMTSVAHVDMHFFDLLAQ